VPPAIQGRLLARYGPASRAAAAGRQQYFAGPQSFMEGLVFNPRRPLFARAAMRQAVNYALDRPALAHKTVEAVAERPTDQLITPGWPGFRDANIYPLGGPDLVTARRLAGRGHRRGVLYACNTVDCIETAGIVRANLAAIGITLEIRRFSVGDMFARVLEPDEPFDVSLFGWIGDTPDPSEFVDSMFGYMSAPTRFLDRTPLGRRIRAASRLTGAARLAAYAALDPEITSQEAPFAPTVSGVHTDFFSARIGCQADNPIYGIELGALCER
jgi:ABC-type transport system substrate-binding protein